MRILELIVALIIGLCIGVGLTMALGVRSPGDNVGDWLAFTGALVGVVATILGAIWLEHYRSSTQEIRQRRKLLDSLAEVNGALTAVSMERGEDPIEVARPARIEAEENLLKAFDKFVFARHFVPREDVDSWYAIEVLQAAISRERAMFEQEVQVIRDAGENENVFRVNISKVSEAAQRIEPLLKAAMSKVGSPLRKIHGTSTVSTASSAMSG